MSFKNLKGILIAPKKGRAPVAPPGYEASDSNPFIFYPILKSCQFRTVKVIKTSCCGSQCHRACSFGNTIVTITYQQCRGCTKS